MNQAEYTRAHHARCRAEAARLSIGYGDPHPDTGMVFCGHSWLKPATFERLRRYDLLRGARSRAAERGLPFELDLDWLKAAWPPNGRCEVLPHITLTWGSKGEKWTSPSIDRIRPELGYTRSNCRVISHRANTLKNNATTQEIALILADLRRHDSAQ